MNHIPVTEFVRPDGKQFQMYVLVSDKLARKATRLLALAGGRFTFERMYNSTISICFEVDMTELEDIVCTVTTLDRFKVEFRDVIEQAYEEMFAKKVKHGN